MSNIIQVDEQMTQRSLDTMGGANPNQTSGNQQLQQTLILDAEEEKEEIRNKQMQFKKNQFFAKNSKDSAQ